MRTVRLCRDLADPRRMCAGLSSDDKRSGLRACRCQGHYPDIQPDGKPIAASPYGRAYAPYLLMCHGCGYWSPWSGSRVQVPSGCSLCGHRQMVEPTHGWRHWWRRLWRWREGPTVPRLYAKQAWGAYPVWAERPVPQRFVAIIERTPI